MSSGYNDPEPVDVEPGDRVSVHLPYENGAGETETRSFEGEVLDVGLEGIAPPGIVRVPVAQNVVIQVPRRSDRLTVLEEGGDA